jgi:hypothetical protein
VVLAEALGRGIDYLRYLSPEYADAPKLRARAAKIAPAVVVRLADGRLGRSRRALDLLSRVMRWLESAIPVSKDILDFLRSERPDLLMVSPLVMGRFRSEQSEYVRAARSLGIRSALLVRSWDNLTNKGVVHDIPDRVYLWNGEQRREAVELHGIPEDRVVATGAYPWDHWFDWKPSANAEEFRRRLGFPVERPILLYMCSSSFIAREERTFVERWLAALREHPDERLRTASVLIRPHPGGARGRWKKTRIAELPGVAVWPRRGELPRDDESRSAYFDSIYHSSAVIGLNTSALIETAIVGRPVFTVLDPAYKATQEGTLHFHYLPRENGGPLNVAQDFPEHFAQLAQVLSGEQPDGGVERAFVRRFVRPHGLDRPALPIFLDAIEDQMASRAPQPATGRVRPYVGLALTPLARLASWRAPARGTAGPRRRTLTSDAPVTSAGRPWGPAARHPEARSAPGTAPTAGSPLPR